MKKTLLLSMMLAAGLSSSAVLSIPTELQPYTIPIPGCGNAVLRYNNDDSPYLEFWQALSHVPEIVLHDSYDITFQGVTISAPLTVIHSQAFSRVTGLQRVTLPNSVTTLDGNGTFDSSVSLEYVKLPENITTIPYSAFNGCTSLHSIVIPDGVTTFGEFAFGSSGLTSVTIPASVNTYISSATNGAFYQCTSLKSVKFEEGFTTIGGAMFRGCTSLNSVEFPQSLTTISSTAFQECINLTNITFPASCTSIDPTAFIVTSGTRQMESITFEGMTPPANLASAFYGTDMSNATIRIPAGANKTAFVSALSTRGVTAANIEVVDTPIVIPGHKAVRISSVNDLVDGGSYLVRSHNILNDSDPYLYLKSNNYLEFLPWATIDDHEKAIFTLQAVTAANVSRNDPDHANITIDETGTSFFNLWNGTRLAYFTADSGTGGGNFPNGYTGDGYMLKAYKVNTIPAAHASAGEQYEAETNADGFMMLSCTSGQWVHTQIRSTSDDARIFGTYTGGAEFYNLTNIKGNSYISQQTYGGHRISPFFIFYKVVPFAEYYAADHTAALTLFTQKETLKNNYAQGVANGVFTMTGWDELVAAKDAMEECWNDLPNATTSDAFDAAYAAFTAAVANFDVTFADVRRGSYIRIESCNKGHYLGMPAPTSSDTEVKFVTDRTNAIYYYSPEGKLINYQYGRAIKQTKDQNNARTNFLRDILTNAEHVTLAEAPVIIFKPAVGLTSGTNNVLSNCYVTWENGTNHSFLYSEGESINGGAASSFNLSGLTAYWTFGVEYVDKLPVTVHSGDNCGSIYLPVEVTVPDTHTVYVATEESDTEGSYLKLTRKTDGVVPAYTHAIISGNAGTVEVEVNYDAEIGSPAENEYLHGHIATLDYPTNSDLVHLEKSSAPAESAVMTLDADNVASAKFVKAEGTIPANALVIKAAQAALTNNALDIPLTEDESAYLTKAGTTTGINRIVVEEANGMQTIYDLQGRRLAKPVKGSVNIINGKKTFIY